MSSEAVASPFVACVGGLYPVSFYEFEEQPDKPIRLAEGDSPTYARTGYAARLIHAVLKLSGFKEVSKLVGTNLVLGEPDQSVQAQFKPFQRMSHYSNTFSLGSKAGYHNLMKRFAERVGEFPSFYPMSFCLPAERAELAEVFNTSPLWISKPGGGARGDGIRVIDKMPEFKTSKTVVQKYIANPMLIHGLKFDLRFYVSVLSLDPLRIYVHENGLVRLATEKYEDNIDDIGNRSAHLTNFSINKKNPAFVATEDMENDGTGNKWTHRPFWPFLESIGMNPDAVRREIEDAFVTVIISARERFMEQANHRVSFELFGFDVMLDDEGKVYILEVNVTPAMGTSSKLDRWVKGPVLKDLYNTALLPRGTPAQETLEKLWFEGADEDVEFIAISEYEITQQRLGGYRCIYPTLERIDSHGQLLVKRTKADIALEKWLKMNDAQKTAFLNERKDAFLSHFK